MKKYSTGECDWSHGAPCDYDNGRPSHKLLGPCPDCGSPTYDYGGGWRCRAMYCNRSDSNPAPSVGKAPTWWDSNINVYLDGDSWCATHDGFINLQESDAGFGDTPQKAVDALLAICEERKEDE